MTVMLASFFAVLKESINQASKQTVPLLTDAVTVCQIEFAKFAKSNIEIRTQIPFQKNETCGVEL